MAKFVLLCFYFVDAIASTEKVKPCSDLFRDIFWDYKVISDRKKINFVAKNASEIIAQVQVRDIKSVDDINILIHDNSIPKPHQLRSTTVRLKGEPSQSLLSELYRYKNIKNEKAEIGLLKIDSHWIIQIADSTAMFDAPGIYAMRQKGLIKVDLHSHPPGDDIWPSIPDLQNLLSLRQGEAFIAAKEGLVKYGFKDNKHIKNAEAAWVRFLKKNGIQGHLKPEAEDLGHYSRFLHEFYHWEVIPWDDSDRIETILH